MNPILVVDYDPRWPAIFATERAGIAALLGELVEDIHHIGSTSVPGLCAKPKIDIDAVLRSDAVIAEAIERVRHGETYAFHGDPYGDGRWTFTIARGSYLIRLYLCGPDNAAHLKRVLFRDWLRSHPGDAADYAALKQRLASQAKGDWELYTGGKSAFVGRIVAMAESGFPSPLAGEGGSALLRRDG